MHRINRALSRQWSDRLEDAIVQTDKITRTTTTEIACPNEKETLAAAGEIANATKNDNERNTMSMGTLIVDRTKATTETR